MDWFSRQGCKAHKGLGEIHGRLLATKSHKNSRKKILRFLRYLLFKTYFAFSSLSEVLHQELPRSEFGLAEYDLNAESAEPAERKLRNNCSPSASSANSVFELRVIQISAHK